MGESEVTKSSLSVNKNEKNGSPRVLNPAISSFFLQLPHKFQNALKVNYLFFFLTLQKLLTALLWDLMVIFLFWLQSHLSKLAKNEGTNRVSSVQRNKSGSFIASEAELNEQLRAWRENPSWVDNPSKIKVIFGVCFPKAKLGLTKNIYLYIWVEKLLQFILCLSCYYKPFR